MTNHPTLIRPKPDDNVAQLVARCTPPSVQMIGDGLDGPTIEVQHVARVASKPPVKHWVVRVQLTIPAAREPMKKRRQTSTQVCVQILVAEHAQTLVELSKRR